MAYLLWPEKAVCTRCGNTTAFDGLRRKNMFKKLCSAKCSANTKEIRNKQRRTLFKNYGVEVPFKSESIRNRAIKTNLKKYGVKYPVALEKNVKKRTDILKKNAVKIGKKRRATMLERYGVEHSLQHRELLEKQQLSGFSVREVITNDKTFIVRGYEDIAIDYLINQKRVKPKHILTTHKDGVPTICYVDSKGSHNYHPDIYIKKTNTLYEVKSMYTAGLLTDKSGMFSIMQKKLDACCEQNYNVILLLVDEEHRVYEVHDVPSKSRKQIKREVGLI